MKSRVMGNKLLYFDHAATSYPKSPKVLAALTDCIKHKGGNPGRSGHALSLSAQEVLYDARCAVCTLTRTDRPEQVVFTQSATYALNMAICCLAEKGAHILISDREHNAVYRPVSRLCREGKVTCSVFRAGDVGDFLQKVTPATTLAVMTHVSNVSGEALPLRKLGRLCRERGIRLILDASQSAGHLPLSPEQIGADVLCAPGHKALGGIQGVGFAVFSPTLPPLPEFISGGSGSYSLLPEMPAVLPDRLEAGTPPTPAIAALCAGIEEMLQQDPTVRESRLSALTARAREMLAETPGITFYGEGGCGILSFNLAGAPSELVAARLGEEGVCVRGGFHCAPLAHAALQTGENGCVRLSFGERNTEAELERFYRIFRRLYREGAFCGRG